MVISARYKRGFREGYNNPNQYSNIDLNKATADSLITGIIDGVLQRKRDRMKGIQTFIWNEKELNEKIKQVV